MGRFGSTGTCMTTQRRSYETGHKPKCLVIVDDTAEWDRAVYYASRWAIRVGGGVLTVPALVYLLGQDYSFGHAVAREARRQMGTQRPDIQIVGDEFHPMLRIKDFAPYATKIKVSKEQMRGVRLVRHATCPTWNYTIKRSRRRAIQQSRFE